MTTPRRTSRRGVAISSGYYVTAAALAVLFLSPLVWTVGRSFTGSQASASGSGAGLRNYERLYEYGSGLWTYVGNSVVVAAIAVVGTLVVTIAGGYAVARFRFPGRNLLFIGALAILMIPHPTILLPIYTLLSRMGLQNSLVAVGVVMIMFQLPFGLFLMRNAFEALPRELEEAAKIDGCNRFTALVRVLLPGVVPAAVTVGIFTFLNTWNEFLAPLILLTDGQRFTLPVALVSIRSGAFGAVDLGALQAGIVVAAIPCVVIFLALQRYYVRGFTAGAVK
ncbi:MAG: carbohydrate ABC transporter permease [Cellulomonas sp.]